MDNNMKLYYDYTISPLGKLFYKTVWSQLGKVKNNKILDFGSGFAFTSNYLGESNEVTGLEINKEIIDEVKENKFTQIHGGLETLKNMKSETYDIIICHLVFEFVENPSEILKELTRVLKRDGFISVVRHNRNGRVIQAIVQDYDLDEAKKVLQGEPSYSSAFGDIKYYENDDILNWGENKIKIEKIYGVRTLASLHNSKIQEKENWLDEMYKMELELLKYEEFIKIAYFNHIILRKN